MSLVLHKLTHWKRLKIQTRDSRDLSVDIRACFTQSFGLAPPSVSEARPPEFSTVGFVLHKLTDWKRLALRPRHSHRLSRKVSALNTSFYCCIKINTASKVIYYTIIGSENIPKKG